MGRRGGKKKSKKNNSLFRTELCRNWKTTGTCPYKKECQFAHDPEELRDVVRHRLYKTIRCKSFHTVGECKYGDRCRFIHNETPEELEAANLEAAQAAGKAEEERGAAPKEKNSEELNHSTTSFKYIHHGGSVDPNGGPQGVPSVEVEVEPHSLPPREPVVPRVPAPLVKSYSTAGGLTVAGRKKARGGSSSPRAREDGPTPPHPHTFTHTLSSSALLQNIPQAAFNGSEPPGATSYNREPSSSPHVAVPGFHQDQQVTRYSSASPQPDAHHHHHHHYGGMGLSSSSEFEHRRPAAQYHQSGHHHPSSHSPASGAGFYREGGFSGHHSSSPAPHGQHLQHHHVRGAYLREYPSSSVGPHGGYGTGGGGAGYSGVSVSPTPPSSLPPFEYQHHHHRHQGPPQPQYHHPVSAHYHGLPHGHYVPPPHGAYPQEYAPLPNAGPPGGHIRDGRMAMLRRQQSAPATLPESVGGTESATLGRRGSGGPAPLGRSGGSGVSQTLGAGLHPTVGRGAPLPLLKKSSTVAMGNQAAVEDVNSALNPILAFRRNLAAKEAGRQQHLLAARNSRERSHSPITVDGGVGSPSSSSSSPMPTHLVAHPAPRRMLSRASSFGGGPKLSGSGGLTSSSSSTGGSQPLGGSAGSNTKLFSTLRPPPLRKGASFGGASLGTLDGVDSISARSGALGPQDQCYTPPAAPTGAGIPPFGNISVSVSPAPGTSEFGNGGLSTLSHHYSPSTSNGRSTHTSPAVSISPSGGVRGSASSSQGHSEAPLNPGNDNWTLY